MQKLICIIGTDGSGKTTLGDAAVEQFLTQGIRARRVWLGAESYLMAPVRMLLKLLWARRNTQTGSGSQRLHYASEIKKKNTLVKRFPWAVSIYLYIVWTDYRLQVWIKRWRQRTQDIIVADRYLFDVAVNIGLTLGWSPGQVVEYCRSRLDRLSLPQVRVFLRVQPEVSLARKDDILDIDYLRLRFSYYEEIARAFGFIERDGTLPIMDNCEWLIQETHAQLARPYVMYVHANNSDIGGADKVLALMAEHMRDYAQGRVRVSVCLRLQTAITEQYSAKSIPVIHHSFVRPQTSRGAPGLLALLLLAPASLWFFLRLFGRERPDIVHVNDLYDILPALAGRILSIPVVWHVRMIKTNPTMRSFFQAAMIWLSPVSISVSKAVRDHYFDKAHAGHQALVIHDLGNAALVADERPAEQLGSRPPGLPGHGRLVLMVGRVEPWKGQHIFLQALAVLPDSLRQEHVFALVGGGVDGKEDYLREVQAAATRANVIMLGQRDDIPELLRAADISVHASVEPDPFPGVVIESMLSGAATIAARAGGAVEVIEAGTSGQLTPPGDAQALAGVLQDWLSSPRHPRARFGAVARERALSLVDASHVDASLAQVYRKLCDHGTSAGREHHQEI